METKKLTWMNVWKLSSEIHSAGDSTRYYADGVLRNPINDRDVFARAQLEHEEFMYVAAQMKDGGSPRVYVTTWTVL